MKETGLLARYDIFTQSGFIRPTLCGPDLYFHRSALNMEASRMFANMRVRFVRGEHEGKPCALQVEATR